MTPVSIFRRFVFPNRRPSLLQRLVIGLCFCSPVFAADLKEAQQFFLTGNYTDAERAAEVAVRESPGDDDWQVLLAQSLLAIGKYAEAETAITNALEAESRSLKLYWQAREVFLSNGRRESADKMLETMLKLASSRPWAYRDAPSLVILGRVGLLRGVDPKKILNQLFDAAKKVEPQSREVYLASGDLALAKHDYALAARTFQQALKQLPEDADVHFGLARAFDPSDDALMIESVEAALKYNSNHIGALLLLVDHDIDAEDYSAAEMLLKRVSAINPAHPEAWAYSAVLAHLQNEPAKEKSALQTALKYWKDNPRVPQLAGRKLSQKYRFAEGAAYQRQALAMDADYLPAKAQLAQDLLRLGDETEGWRLAQEVQRDDAYDVFAFNLASLHDSLSKFVTLTNGDFLVRMGAHEAAVYGTQALDLLSEARKTLCAKYGFEVKRPTVVEIFPDQKDFAVRTFGLPGNPGYLGVCFGSVITANSPAAHVGDAVNWHAVLWHEFCHVVTLQLTHNKMPRWLSEGISVYEERVRDSAWGQAMTPDYRSMVMNGPLTPISDLSAAFLTAKSDKDVQFAYYESALVVEFIVKNFGPKALAGILKDLGEGTEISKAIEKNTQPMEQIETNFVAFARKHAQELGPALDWEKPDFLEDPQEKPDWEAWAKEHPTNFWAITREARELYEKKDYQAARPVLERLIQLDPDYVGNQSPYRMLAITERALGDTNAERQTLIEFAQRDDKAGDAFMRLMELGKEAKDWSAVRLNATRYLGVNPLVPSPYRFAAEAAEQTGAKAEAIGSWRSLLELDPADPADVHFHLARLYRDEDKGEAKRQVLQSLEDAPRFRPALQLLLELNAKSQQVSEAGPKS